MATNRFGRKMFGWSNKQNTERLSAGLQNGTLKRQNMPQFSVAHTA
ncbi:Uncharacterised protein [Vibrio cholerae]|nr:Uncharacterised protein [Vibrio cholerae]CSB93837.1 Uncharacterised protein [Vibrio cholerae]